MSAAHPKLEVFLRQIDHELFRIPDKTVTYSNVFKEEWQAIRYIDEDRSIVLKKADKGSCVEFSDSYDYVSEADKQISDKSIYKNVSFSEKIP